VVAGPRRFSLPWVGHRPMATPVRMTILLSGNHSVFMERNTVGSTTKLSSRELVTFSIFSCFLHIQPAVFQAPDKAVILSEALRKSIANRGLHSAESKDPGDACWQMLSGAFRPQTTPEDKKVTDSDRSEA
jgi:hypothetical protein